MSRRVRSRDERGVALVMVLFVFMTLAVLAWDFSRFMRADAMAALNAKEATRGYYLALAGMNRAIYELMEARESGQEAGLLADEYFVDAEGGDDFEHVNPFQASIPPDGVWHEGDFGAGRYAVRVVDEAGLVAINAVSEELLRHLVISILSDGDVAAGQSTKEVKTVQTIVDSILDWRDPDDLARLEGAESAYYEALQPPYRPTNGFFQAPSELTYVRGVPPELVFGTEVMPGLAEIVTVFGREQGINIRSVTAPVLQVLLGVDRQTADELILLRTEDPIVFPDALRTEVANVDMTLVPYLSDDPARVVRIDGRADVSSERNQARLSMVVDLDAELFDGPRVLRWLDDASMASVYDESTRMADVEEEGAGG